MKFKAIFPSFPEELCNKLEEHYKNIKSNYIQGNFEPSELNAAKFCEVTYRLLEWHTSTNNQYTDLDSQIRNFEDSSRKFENLSSFHDSVRFFIPNICRTLYRIRNKRGVGHISGNINANYMDSTLTYYSVNWILCELIRIFHGLTIPEVDKIIKSISANITPLIWEVGGSMRVLHNGLKCEEKILLLLGYEPENPLSDKTLLSSIEYSNPHRFKKILRKLHNDRLLEYNESKGILFISPIGLKKVQNIHYKYTSKI